jgi:DMSO reductase anchor subunit
MCLGVLTAVVGVAAVMCSVMIYVDTQRDFWSFGATTRKFFLTCAVLGIPTAIISAHVAAFLIPSVSPYEVLLQVAHPLWMALAVAMGFKLFEDAGIFMSLMDARTTSLKRTALLMAGELSRQTFGSFACGLVGGILLPLAFITTSATTSAADASGSIHVVLATVALGLVAIGEILERYLFFAAVVAPKMPGSPAS